MPEYAYYYDRKVTTGKFETKEGKRFVWVFFQDKSSQLVPLWEVTAEPVYMTADSQAERQ